MELGLDPAGNGEPLRAEGREQYSYTTLGIWAQTSQVVALGVKLSLPVAVESVLERLEQQPQDSAHLCKTMLLWRQIQVGKADYLWTVEFGEI